jgi:hypothetical protein
MDSVMHVMDDDRYDIVRGRVQSSTNVQVARNEMVRWFLQSDREWMWFLDTDMVFDADVPARLIAHDAPITSALYLGQGNDGEPFVVGHRYSIDGGFLAYLKRDDLDGLSEVAAVGMGCAMIRRDVLVALGENGHPHQWPFAMAGLQNTFVGEDVGFCLRAGSLGYKSYIDADTFVGHVKSFILAPTAENPLGEQLQRDVEREPRPGAAKEYAAAPVRMSMPSIQER